MSTERLVAVTNACTELGLAIATTLGRAGYHVWLLDADDAALRTQVARVLAAVPQGRVAATAVGLDAPTALTTLREASAAVWQRMPQVWVQDARVTRASNSTEAAGTELASALDLIRVGAGLISDGSSDGAMVILGSPLVHLGLPGEALDSAVQGGLAAFCTTMAREVAAQGTRLNVLSVGQLNDVAFQARSEAEKAHALGRIPMGRAGTCEEVAAAAAFLCRSGFMTATVLAVDGGLS